MGYFDNIRQKLTGQSQQQQPQNQQGSDNNEGNQQQNLSQRSQSAGIPQEPAGVLDAYKDLYTPDTKEPEKAPEFNLAADKLDGVVNSQDFMQGVNPELMQKLQSGDMSALGEIINHATRRAYRSALEHGSTLTGKFVDARLGFSEKNLDSRIRSSNLNDHLSQTPNFSNPVVKQHMTSLVNQLSSKHPDAPMKDIVEEAKRIMMEVARGVNPEAEQPQGRQKTTEDWEAYITG